MPGTRILLTTGVLVCAATVGCNNPKKVGPAKMPTYVLGTVAEHATYLGLPERRLQGYGVVLGLGTNGSSEVPPRLRAELVRYLQKQNLGFYRYGSEHLHPLRILGDLDTAVVLMGGVVPHGAPAGSRFDLSITSLPGTGTKSLDGGRLMPAEMRIAVRGSAPHMPLTRAWAMGGGEVFVDPFLDPADPEDRAKMREGRILGGGLLTKQRPIRLVLAKSDYATCSYIRDRINERFSSGGNKIADAKSATTIEITVPGKYARDYDHFLALLLHLPLLRDSKAIDVRAREIVRQMHEPGAPYESLSLTLEATGRDVLPVLQDQYDSAEPAAAYYIARAGLRLGDTAAAPTIMALAQTGGSPQQIPAIEELGRHRGLLEATAVFRSLLDDDSALVRIAAYEALLKHGDYVTVRRRPLSKYVRMDIVKSRGKRMIYATRTGEARIAVFGEGMSVKQPLFFSLPDDLVTISAVEENGVAKLMAYRKIARWNRFSESCHCDLRVSSLVKLLGSDSNPDDPDKEHGLALTYSQVLRVLYGMCKQGHIDAEFVLQRPAGMQRIYRGGETVGRPEAPE